MKIKNLRPNEILTTMDFPVHNEHILRIYFKICQKGSEDILPPTPVIPFSVGIPLLKTKDKKSKEYNKRIRDYLRNNPKVKYLMLDGSHKTTALTLNHRKIHCVIIKTESDVKEIEELIKIGEIFGIHTMKPIKDLLLGMARHFKNAKFFESVEDKTKRMVKEKVIPQFMVDHYKRK